MRPTLSRSLYWLAAALLLLVLAVGAGVAVQADREPAPVVHPYDPLPRW
jgi:hypothetical protein